MADNLTVTQGSGVTVAADEIGGVKYQRIKLSVGADGEAADLDSGQQTKANSISVTLASDDSLTANLSSAHDAADAGNALKIGGKALTNYTVPTAVNTGDRVDAHFNQHGQLVVDINNGPVVHDGVDYGTPAKIGGKAALTPPTAVSSGDRVNAWFDLNGRVVIDANYGPTNHNDADSGTPVKIGGRAVDSAPTAVDSLDRVNAWFDTTGRLVVDVNKGPVAHDAADSGNPIKVGGKASTSMPSAVANADRVDAFFDQYGRLNVVSAPSYRRVSISAADPTATATSDIVQVDGTDIEAADFTIRDTNNHRFYIPMAKSGYRTAMIYIENDSTAWDQVPAIKLYGCANVGGGFIGALLLSITGVVTGSNRIAIGVGSAGVGGQIGTSTVPGTNYWYQCDAIAAGWEYIELRISFSSSPSQGEIDDIVVIRQG